VFAISESFRESSFGAVYRNVAEYGSAGGAMARALKQDRQAQVER
jgi:hypothetical protein